LTQDLLFSMTEFGETAGTLEKRRAMKAQFVRVLSERIREISTDPQQTRNLVYELARLKLAQELGNNSEQAWLVQRTLESAIRDVEQGFVDAGETAADPELQTDSDVRPPAFPDAGPGRDIAASRSSWAFTFQPLSALIGRTRRSRGTFASIVRLAMVLVVVGLIGGAGFYWTRPRPQLAGPFNQAPSSTTPNPTERQAQITPPAATSESTPAPASTSTASLAERSMPLPSTFGVYALSDGQLQELKALPGKVPDRRVAISAAITTPSATTVTSGDIKFIVFRPDSAIEASGTEVRVVAKVARAMGVDASGKASMVHAGDSWVIRSTSFPYKVGPVEDQPRMLLLQPENDGFALSPGRYVVVVKGLGYDFTVAGDVTAPDQCVERINAANGAFYSPCPPKR
jgi:hypothetical protein